MLSEQIVLSNSRGQAWRGSLFYLGFFLSAGSYAPFIYVYYTDLGLTGQQIGLLASMSPLITLLLATPISSLADRKRWRVRIAQIAIAGMSTALFLLRYPASFTGIAGLMFVLAICMSPVMSIADSLIARMARRHRLNYGGMRLWGSIGFASSALIFGTIWQRLDIRAMFLVGSLMFIPLIWITGRLEEGSRKEQAGREGFSVLLRDTGLLYLLLATFLASICNSLALTFEGIYVRFLGGGNFLIGMMIAFSAYSELPTMFFSQRIAKKLRSINTVMIAYGLMASAYLGYVLLANPNVMPFFSVLKGLGYGLFFTTTVQIITERTPDEWASTAQSFMTICTFGLAPIVAGPLGGLIHDTFSPRAVFVLGIIALFLAAIVLTLGKQRKILE